MPDDVYERPRQAMGPLVGLIDAHGSGESFATVDRRERTDPFGYPVRPEYLEPTPQGAQRRSADRPILQSPEPPPAEPRWPWVVGGLSIGAMVTVTVLVWIQLVFVFDEDGLLPLPDPANVAEGQVSR